MYFILNFLIYALTGLLTWRTISCICKHLTIATIDAFLLKFFRILGAKIPQDGASIAKYSQNGRWRTKIERQLRDDKLRYLPFAFFYPYGENYVRIGALDIWNVSIISFILLLGSSFMAERFYIKSLLLSGGNAFVLVILTFFFKGIKLSGEWLEKGMFLGIVRFYAHIMMLPLTQAFPFTIILGIKPFVAFQIKANEKDSVAMIGISKRCLENKHEVQA